MRPWPLGQLLEFLAVTSEAAAGGDWIAGGQLLFEFNGGLMLRRLWRLGWLLLELAEEVMQLRSGDVGPAAALLQVLQQFKQLVAVGGQAAAQGAVLDAAMQLFQFSQQVHKRFRLVCQLLRKAEQLGQQGIEALLWPWRSWFLLLFG